MNETLLQVACPHCHAVNRVPAMRLADGPVCGRCKSVLLPAEPFALDAAGFDAHALRSDIPLLVDFWAPWCGPCRMMAPAYAQAAADLAPRVQLGKVDTEAEQGLGARFGIRSIPTIMIFKKGEVVDMLNGAVPKAPFDSWLNESL